jgi:hypothetical protein
LLQLQAADAVETLGPGGEDGRAAQRRLSNERKAEEKDAVPGCDPTPYSKWFELPAELPAAEPWANQQWEASSFRGPADHVAKAERAPENALSWGLRELASTVDWDYNKGEHQQKHTTETITESILRYSLRSNNANPAFKRPTTNSKGEKKKRKTRAVSLHS